MRRRTIVRARRPSPVVVDDAPNVSWSPSSAARPWEIGTPRLVNAATEDNSRAIVGGGRSLAPVRITHCPVCRPGFIDRAAAARCSARRCVAPRPSRAPSIPPSSVPSIYPLEDPIALRCTLPLPTGSIGDCATVTASSVVERLGERPANLCVVVSTLPPLVPARAPFASPIWSASLISTSRRCRSADSLSGLGQLGQRRGLVARASTADRAFDLAIGIVPNRDFPPSPGAGDDELERFGREA